jgi:hypothetical protein
MNIDKLHKCPPPPPCTYRYIKQGFFGDYKRVPIPYVYECPECKMTKMVNK